MVTSLFSAEHDALRDSVRRWVEREAAPHAADWERAGGWPRAVLAALGQHGWLGLALAPEAGGDVLAGVVVAEELGRLRSAGVVHDVLAQAHAAAVLAEFAAADAEAALAGARAVTLVGGDLTLRDGPDGGVLAGSAPSVANAAWADRAVAVVPQPDGLALVVVDTGAPGWAAQAPAAPFGRRAGHVADVTLTDVAVAPSAVPARGQPARELMLRRRERWRLEQAAATVASSWQAFQDAKAYAHQREAFGRPIGTFQVNRHALADMAAELTAATSLVRDTARRLTRGELADGDTAALRLYAGRVATTVADRCLQLHGGYGYTTEFDVQRAWRDAAHLRVEEGGDDALRDESAAAMESRAKGAQP